MKNLLTTYYYLLLVLTLIHPSLARAADTAFTYAGQLAEGGAPASGSYDLKAILFNADIGGSQIGPIVTNSAVAVNSGWFTTRLDFGPGVFTGDSRWIELSVRRTGTGTFTTLTPRQALTPTPYAQYAMTPAGPKGDKGDKGDTGPKGDPGIPGAKGDTGLQGPTGPAGSADAWGRTGNSGTDPNLNFAGTTDGAPFVIRAGNQNIWRLEGQSTGIRIIGGRGNSISATSTNSATLAGRNNSIDVRAHESSIVGGLDNLIGADQRSAFIGGGARNLIREDNQHAVIVGGRDNSIGTNCVISLVVGGAENRLANNVDGGLMVGGFRNDILGSLNSGQREIAPVLLGGSDNEIGRSSSFTVILGGDNNRIGTNCPSAVIAGGTNNVVADNCGYSFAVGARARVNHQGSFVWSDSQSGSFASQAVNSFNMRAEGGLYLSGDTSQFFGNTTRQMLNLWGTSYGIGVQSFTFYCRTDDNGSFSWFRGGVHSNSANTPGAGGTEMMRLNSGGLRVNGTFVSASDRNQKQGVEPVDCREVLDRVASLPIAKWSYIQDPGTRHLGPMAQDFHAAFAVGPDDKHIATVDADGVALAAIKGLNQKLEDQKAALDAKEERISRLEAELAELRSLLRAGNKFTKEQAGL